MADKPLFNLDAEGRWRLAYDRQQWVLQRIIHGRIYRNITELRDAVRGFVERYNAQWIVEKNGYLSPAQARQAWHAAISLRPAA